MNLFDILFPRRCVSCGKLGRYFCSSCTSIIQIIKVKELICPVCGRPAILGMTHARCQTKYALDGLISFFRYQGPIKHALKKIKYHFVSDLAKEFIELIPDSSLQLLTPYSQSAVLIPIPLHPSRFRFRGFNQAELLGKLVAEKLNIPIKTDILKKVRKTIPQVEIQNRKKRLTNMENVFSLSGKNLFLQNPYIFLFDDVFTTGATLKAAATALKKAGAKKVFGITLAHG